MRWDKDILVEGRTCDLEEARPAGGGLRHTESEHCGWPLAGDGLCGQRKAGKRQGDLEEPGMLPSSEELAVGMGGDLPSHTARSRVGC